MSERTDPATAGGNAEAEVTARGYRDTPGNEQGTEGSALDPGAGGASIGNAAGPDRGPERAFGADPGGRERFDAANAYGADIDPDEMGGLAAPGAGAATPDPDVPGSGTHNRRQANAGGTDAGVGGQDGPPSSDR
jgi:hypothetical protein